MRQLLETLGRHSLDMQNSGVDVVRLWSRLGPLYEYATSDRAGFLAELRAVAAQAGGGFASLGAAHLVWEFYSGDALRDPAALPLIDGGIDVKLSRGLSTAALTGYEMKRLAQLREQAR